MPVTKEPPTSESILPNESCVVVIALGDLLCGLESPSISVHLYFKLDF
ncbi:hypothetical protein [Paenibacillus pinistramenti]|nr:hypothetical protein [Paenibacillus pinistramenti]